MSEKLTVYEKPTCTTCRNLAMLLKEKGYDFDRQNYFIEPIGRAKLEELLTKMHARPRDIIRSKEARFRELGLAGATDEQLLEALVTYPELVQRPIVEKGDRAVVARPAEKVLEIL
jgi:arsenate reductase (glutaredoxin)